MGQQADYSLEVAHEIDEEVRALIEAAHTEAWEILNTYRDVLDELAAELLETETLNRKDLQRVFTKVEKRPRITAFNDFGGRTPSDKPPVQTPGERAIERGEPWPPPAPEPYFRQPEPVGAGHQGPSLQKGQPDPYGPPPQPGQWGPVPGHQQGAPGQSPPPSGSRPDYGAPPGWSAPGWPPDRSTPAPPPENGQNGAGHRAWDNGAGDNGAGPQHHRD